MDLLTIYLNVDREVNGNNINSWANSILEITIPLLDDYFSNNRSSLLVYLGKVQPSLINRTPQYEIEIIAEEGSIKTWLKISLAIFIGYGSIRQSIDYAIKDSKEISKIATETVISGKNIKHKEIINRRTTIEDPQKLLKLFELVESGKLSAIEATEAASKILQINPEKITTKLSKEFFEAQKKSDKINPSHHKIPMITEKKLQNISDNLKPMSTKIKKQKGVKLNWNSLEKNPVVREYYK